MYATKEISLQEISLQDLGVEQLDDKEAKKVSGGIIQAIALGLGLLGGVALLAYGAGYLYGKLTCE